VKVDDRKLKLDPEAPGLDDATRLRRRALAKMQEMSGTELLALAVRARIYNDAGNLMPPIRADAEPSASRPKD
jgi:hypothetical protein